MMRTLRPAMSLTEVYLYRYPVDFRKSYRGLSDATKTSKSASNAGRHEQLNALSVDELLSRLDEQSRALDAHDQVIQKKSDVIESQQKRIALLEEYLRLERLRHFGPSSEKNPNQDDIFDEVELEGCGVEESDEDEENGDDDSDASKPKKKRGRKALSSSLPRHQVFIDLSDEEKAGAIDTYYTKVKEELDIVPAKAQVVEYLQEKAVFADENGRRILSADLPLHPLGKAIASPGTLAHIIVSKYCDGLPLYRLEGILERYGGGVTRTTMANWLIRLTRELQPLIHLMREHQNGSDYLQMDETRVQVLKEPGYSVTSDKWMWVVRGGPPGPPCIIFAYDPSRSQEVPLRLLEGFRGYLQADGYAGYGAVCRANGLVQDHARRKFRDAKKAQPKESKTQGRVSKADVALGKIGKLYMVERQIEALTPQERYRERQAKSVPLLNDLKTWLDKNAPKVAKDSLTRTAMTYMLNQWDKLIRYCDDGRLNISNALAENAIRPFAVGRRNWLFADTPAGANASALYYSLVETAKANDLEPYAYFKYVLARIAYADTVEEMEALLPWNMPAELTKPGVNNPA